MPKFYALSGYDLANDTAVYCFYKALTFGSFIVIWNILDESGRLDHVQILLHFVIGKTISVLPPKTRSSSDTRTWNNN